MAMRRASVVSQFALRFFFGFSWDRQNVLPAFDALIPHFNIYIINFVADNLYRVFRVFIFYHGVLRSGKGLPKDVTL